MCHDQLDVLGFETTVVNLFIVIIVFLDLLVLNSLALTVLGGVVVSGVVLTSLLGCGKLLSSGSLVLRVEVFDLGLTEDTA